MARRWDSQSDHERELLPSHQCFRSGQRLAGDRAQLTHGDSLSQAVPALTCPTDDENGSVLDIDSLPQARGQKFKGSGRLRSASDPLGPVRRNSRAPHLGFEPGRCLTEGWKTGDWSNAGCRFAVEVDQAEFLYSRIFSIRWVSETLSHRTLHPPMAYL